MSKFKIGDKVKILSTVTVDKILTLSPILNFDIRLSPSLFT